MPQDTIEKIKGIFKDSDKLNFDDTERLTELLAQLQTELASLPKTQKAQALEIATLMKKNIEMSKMQELKESDFSDLGQIIEYEVNHPKLTYTVRSIYNLLFNIGI